MGIQVVILKLSNMMILKLSEREREREREGNSEEERERKRRETAMRHRMRQPLHSGSMPTHPQGICARLLGGDPLQECRKGSCL